jgi:predicted MFS family arabinose efflux permease
VLGEIVLGDGRYDAVFLVAALACVLAAVIALAAPNRVAGLEGTAVTAPERPRRGFHRAAVLPGLVLACGVGSFAAFSAFLPTHAEDLGMPVSGPFVVYSVLCLLIRLFGARLPERMGLGVAVTQALAALAVGLVLLSVLDQPAGVYLGTIVLSIGTALLYPSLMAFAVNSASAADRTWVLATFTMFFEVGTIVGGLLLGPTARFFGDQGAFLGGAVMALVGLVVLRRLLLPAAQAEQEVPVAAAVPAPDYAGGLAVGE